MSTLECNVIVLLVTIEDLIINRGVLPFGLLVRRSCTGTSTAVEKQQPQSVPFHVPGGTGTNFFRVINSTSILDDFFVNIKNIIF